MPARRTPRRFRLVVLAAAAAYALAAATTAPFSVGADVVTAVAIVTLAAGAVVRWPARPRPCRPATGARHPFVAWALLGAVVVACELAEYLARGRRDVHPTLSSMADAVDHVFAVKAVVFFGWLCLGGAIVHLGAAAGAPAQPEAEAEVP